MPNKCANCKKKNVSYRGNNCKQCRDDFDVPCDPNGKQQADNDYYNPIFNPINNPIFNRKRKVARQEEVAAALEADTDEGIAMTLSECRYEFRTNVLSKMEIIMPKNGAEACIGIRNNSSLRTQENYPNSRGWQNNGSKGAPDKRDNVIYRTKNQMTARRMEQAAICNRKIYGSVQSDQH